MDLTPAMVKAAKAAGQDEPEYYLVQCARRDQAITVANYFNMEDAAIEAITTIEPSEFPVKLGLINTGQHVILKEGQNTKMAMHTDIIDFKNWIVIRSEDDSDVRELYEKLGMEINHGSR